MSGPMMAPGTVVDTTGDAQWEPTRVTAVLAHPIVGLPRNPLHLDGPLAWAAYVDAQTDPAEQPLHLPPMREWAHDFALPLATWTGPCTRPDPDPRLLAADGASAWGWACSRGHYRVLRHTVAAVRRRPPLDEMVQWTRVPRHHPALGPRRAADDAHQAVWVDQVEWWALADLPRLRHLLTRLRYLGRLARHGWGKILTVTAQPDPAADAWWRWRHMPHPDGTVETIRAPYHHRSRAMPCRMQQAATS